MDVEITGSKIFPSFETEDEEKIRVQFRKKKNNNDGLPLGYSLQQHV